MTQFREISTAFDLPWPWGGERFELGARSRLTWITGPLGSGKTRLAAMLARHLPDTRFVGLERLDDDGAAARAPIERDTFLRDRVDGSLARFDLNAAPSGALIALLTALEATGPRTLVIDMIEQGLDEATQVAVAAYVREHQPVDRPLVMLTRSTAMLDLDRVGADETIILCPANHSPPILVEPRAGAFGYESVVTCLAPPSVRARVATPA